MQATHLPVDAERQARDAVGAVSGSVRRDAGPVKSSLEGDTQFAEEALAERRTLLPKAISTGHTIAYGLDVHTSNKRFMLVAWLGEILVLLFVVMSMATELFSSCPLEMGLYPACHKCFSHAFLGWQFVWVWLYFLNLFAFALLVSRGFSYRVRTLSVTVTENLLRDIPGPAIQFLIWSTVAVVIWYLLGFLVVAFSNNCAMIPSDGFGKLMNSRSEIMYWSMIMVLIATPVLLILGRVFEISEKN